MLYRLSRTQREIHRLSREAPLETFQNDAFEAMKELISFDTGFWGGGVPTVPPTLHYVHLHRLPEEMTAAFEQVKSHPKMIESVSFATLNAGRAITTDTKEQGTDFFYRVYGVDKIMTIYQPDTDLGLYHVLSLYRSGEKRFTEQERALFECVVPHLLDAYRENRLLHLSSNNLASLPFAAPAALVDWGGVVHFARPAFVELLRREWPGWNGPLMPEPVRRMQDGVFVGGEVAMRLARHHDLSLAVLRKKGPLDQLTARELEVAKQLARGSSYKEIANNLAIAVTTARNHITSIYAKLDCNKGTQIAHMFATDGWF